MDLNGTVAEFDGEKYTVIFKGQGENTNGLFYEDSINRRFHQSKIFKIIIFFIIEIMKFFSSRNKKKLSALDGTFTPRMVKSKPSTLEGRITPEMLEIQEKVNKHKKELARQQERKFKEAMKRGEDPYAEPSFEDEEENRRQKYKERTAAKKEEYFEDKRSKFQNARDSDTRRRQEKMEAERQREAERRQRMEAERQREAERRRQREAEKRQRETERRQREAEKTQRARQSSEATERESGLKKDPESQTEENVVKNSNIKKPNEPKEEDPESHTEKNVVENSKIKEPEKEDLSYIPEPKKGDSSDLSYIPPSSGKSVLPETKTLEKDTTSFEDSSSFFDGDGKPDTSTSTSSYDAFMQAFGFSSAPSEVPSTKEYNLSKMSKETEGIMGKASEFDKYL